MARYVALLRGINVGGNNLIRMADLRVCFEDLGLQNVSTYITSGNVIFESGERSSTKLTQRIEKALTKTFGYQAVVVVRSQAQMRSIVNNAPKGMAPSHHAIDPTSSS